MPEMPAQTLPDRLPSIGDPRGMASEPSNPNTEVHPSATTDEAARTIKREQQTFSHTIPRPQCSHTEMTATRSLGIIGMSDRGAAKALGRKVYRAQYTHEVWMNRVRNLNVLLMKEEQHRLRIETSAAQRLSLTGNLRRENQKLRGMLRNLRGEVRSRESTIGGLRQENDVLKRLLREEEARSTALLTDGLSLTYRSRTIQQQQERIRELESDRDIANRRVETLRDEMGLLSEKFERLSTEFELTSARNLKLQEHCEIKELQVRSTKSLQGFLLADLGMAQDHCVAECTSRVALHKLVFFMTSHVLRLMNEFTRELVGSDEEEVDTEVLLDAVVSCNRSFTPIHRLFELYYAKDSLSYPIRVDEYELNKLIRGLERGWNGDCERVNAKLLEEGEEQGAQDAAEEDDEDEDLVLPEGRQPDN